MRSWEETGKGKGSAEQHGSGTEILGLLEHLDKDLLTRMRGPAFLIYRLQVRSPKTHLRVSWENSDCVERERRGGQGEGREGREIDRNMG